MGDRFISFECAHCGTTASRRAGDVNRARRQGLQLYCDRRCSGLGRRVPDEVKRANKAEYHRKRRAELGDEYRRQKRESYYRNHEKNLKKGAEKRAAIRADPEKYEAEKAYKREAVERAARDLDGPGLITSGRVRSRRRAARETRIYSVL